MTPHGVLLALLYFIALTDKSIADDCTTYTTGNSSLLVPSGSECSLATDLSVSGNITVYGSIQITTGTLVRIQAATIDIKPGGKVYADAVAVGGTGLGNLQGSGGAILNSFKTNYSVLLVFMYFRILTSDMTFSRNLLHTLIFIAPEHLFENKFILFQYLV